MRIGLLAFVVLLWVPRDALAIHAPSEEQWKQIKEILDEGRRIKKDLDDHRRDRIEQGQPDDDRKAIALQFDRDVQYARAVQLALKAYGLPESLAGTSVLPVTKGQHVAWVISPGERDDRKKKFPGRPDYEIPDMDKAGVTAAAASA